MKKNLFVCERCLYAIISHEGNIPTLKHDIELEFDEEEFEKNSTCDWCKESDNNILYELI